MLPVGEEEHIACVAQDGGHVGRNEVFALSQADYDRRALSRGDDLVWIQPAQHGKRKNSADVFQRGTDSALQIAFEILFHKMRDDFGIGFRLEAMPLALELFFRGRKFSTMPLWTTTMSPVQSRCGCAFSSVGRPCVAQRVWPMP